MTKRQWEILQEALLEQANHRLPSDRKEIDDLVALLDPKGEFDKPSHYMPLVPFDYAPHFSDFEMKEAASEGWLLATVGSGPRERYELETIDEPDRGDRLSGGDEEAYDIVVKKALDGSRKHILALYLDGQKVKNLHVPARLLESGGGRSYEGYRDLLRKCRSMIRDGLIKSWAADDLCDNPRLVVADITGVLGDGYNIETGNCPDEPVI